MEVAGHSPHVPTGTESDNFNNITNVKYQTITPINNFGKGFSISSQNCRSLLKNADKLADLLERSQPSVIALQEIWHSNSSFEGYNSYSIERVNKRGGGVAILVKNTLDAEPLFSHIDFNVEIIGVMVDGKVTVSIYLPPKSVLATAREKVLSLLKKYTKKEIYLAGDLNVDLLKSNQCTEIILDMCQDLFLCPTTAYPTRITEHSATLIDGIFTNSKKDHVSGIFTTDVSDHLTPFLVVKESQQRESTNTVTYRKIGEEEIKNLKLFLKNENWEPLDLAEPGHKYEKFSEIFSSTFDLLCPEREKSRNRKLHPEKEFMTFGLLKSRNTKDDLKSIFVKNKKCRLNTI